LKGEAYSDGIGLGHVVLHEPRIVVTELLNDDIDAELKRLDDALGSLRISIDDMLSRRDVSMEGEHRAVLEAYRMFAHDRGWVRKLEEAIRNGLTSEAAVEKVQSDTRARMIHMTDPYLRERLQRFRRSRQPAAQAIDRFRAWRFRPAPGRDHRRPRHGGC
jgi:phosphotransferase system enzyme I (PtsP)